MKTVTIVIKCIYGLTSLAISLIFKLVFFALSILVAFFAALFISIIGGMFSSFRNVQS